MNKAVIFDMDGLLLDSERPVREAWMAAMNQTGHAWDEAAYLEMLGRNERDSRAICLKNFGGEFPYDDICSRVRSILLERIGKTGYELMAGAGETVKYLAGRSVPCGVATSTAGARARLRLEQAGLLQYMRAVCGGDEVAHGKPEPDLFLLVASKLGVIPQRCLVLEDSPSGAEGAVKAGMQVLLIPDVKPPTENVRDIALGVYASLHDCRAALDRWLDGA